VSLIKRIVGLIEQHGSASTYELIQFVHDEPRDRIIKAVQNAAHLGYVRCIGLTERNGRAQGAGIWVVVKEPQEPGRPARPRVSSVWDLARG
jgi:hypothetical protein